VQAVGPVADEPLYHRFDARVPSLTQTSSTRISAHCRSTAGGVIQKIMKLSKRLLSGYNSTTGFTSRWPRFSVGKSHRWLLLR